jgi:hypothetical protein
MHCLIPIHPVINQAVGNFHRSAGLAASVACPAALRAADSPTANAKPAFRNGTVINQQTSDSEPLYTGMCAKHALLNSRPTRYKPSGEKFFTAPQVWRQASLARRHFVPLIRLRRMPNLRFAAEP